VHAVIGTGREEKVGAVIACLAARDARGALAAFDAAIAGGADPGGVLEQLLAALRDSLLASVGCGDDLLVQGDGLGVDLAALGREWGTVTLLAMLQIIDQALGRMRSSGHAAVLAEMAIVRLASLEDLDSLAEAVDRIGATAVHVPRAAAAERVAEPPREKKTTDLSGAAAPAGIPDPIGRPPEPLVAPDAVAGDAALVAVGLPALASDPLAAWRQAAEAVGGLAVDFADLAVRADWRQDVLEVVLPASAGNAAAFLRRPEIAAGLSRALSECAGRPLRQSLEIDAVTGAASAAEPGGAGTAPAERGRPVVSQAALLREVADHPLVAQVRTLFDAAVRKVEPARSRPNDAVTAPAGGASAAEAAVDHEDEGDLAVTHDGDGGIDG